MPNCNFNGCFSGPSTPRRIFTRSCNSSCSVGRVVNPQDVLQYAVYKQEEPSEVASGEVIPLARSHGSGTAISGAGPQVNLTAGTYRILYNALATLPDSDSVSTILRLDNVDVSTTQSVVSGNPGEDGSLSNQIILNLENAGVLTLINNSATSVEFLTENLSVDKL